MANWFTSGGDDYARFRPTYPPAVAELIAAAAPARRSAIDVGCGNGQFTGLLAQYFDEVMGLDPSADQVANAPVESGLTFVCAPAEDLPIADDSVDAVTVAQAAHWFDLPRFYDEVRRVCVDGAVLALITYTTVQFDDPILQASFDDFYAGRLAPYWPPERRSVELGYADLDFPFEEFPMPAPDIEREVNLAELFGYFGTWSAVRRARDAGDDALDEFAAQFAPLWGDPEQRRTVRSPVTIRAGRIRLEP